MGLSKQFIKSYQYIKFHCMLEGSKALSTGVFNSNNLKDNTMSNQQVISPIK